MALKFPNSTDECLYFTNRQIGNEKIIAWVYKRDCPKCHKAKMGKPIDKDGNVKMRAKEYTCPGCGHTEDKEVHEESSDVEVQYTCNCGYTGEATTKYKRTNFQGVPSYVFTCQGCGKKMPITKKMKNTKNKEGK